MTNERSETLNILRFLSLACIIFIGLMTASMTSYAIGIPDGTARRGETVSASDFIDDVPIRPVPAGVPLTVSNSYFEVSLSSDKYVYFCDYQIVFLWAHVKNLGNSEDKFVFKLISEAPEGWSGTQFIGGDIRLEAGEEGDVKFMYGPVYESDVEQQVESNFTLEVEAREQRETLSFTVSIIVYSSISHSGYKPDAIVKGTVTDASTGDPVSGAEVSIWLGPTIRIGSGSVIDMLQETDSMGLYERKTWDINVLNNHYSPYITVQGYRLVVQKEGYETYVHNEHVKPQNGSPLTLDVSLAPLENPVNFELKWDTSLSSPGVFNIAVTEAWDRFAVAMGKHGDPDDPDFLPSEIPFIDSEGNILWTKSLHDQSWAIDATDDGAYIACATESLNGENYCYLWDANGNEVWKKSIPSHSLVIKFSRDNQYIATGPAEDGTMFVLYDTLTGAEKWKHSLDDKSVRATAFTEDGQYILIGGHPHFFTLGGDFVWRGYMSYTPYRVCPSSNGSRFMVPDKGDCISMFDGNGNLLWRKEQKVITYGAMSADGSVVVATTTHGYVFCYDGEGEIKWYSFLPGCLGSGGHNNVDVTPDGKYIVVGGGGYSTVLYDSDGNVLWRHTSPYDSGGGSYKQAVMAVRISGDGEKIVSGYGASDPRFCYFEKVIDTTAPSVSSTSPAADATGVAVNTSISATFSEAMNSTTITTDTFTVSTGGSNISGSVSYSDKTATFKPSSNLSNSKTYTATITTGAKDKAGNAMASGCSWSFTTVSSGGGGGGTGGGNTGSGDSGGGGGCFIATACYGTSMAEEVKTLCAFRDQYLLTKPPGQALVKFYYRYSPKVADFIRRREYLKRVVREGLKPLIWIARKIVN